LLGDRISTARKVHRALRRAMLNGSSSHHACENHSARFRSREDA
jgi:hypothetical protein